MGSRILGLGFSVSPTPGKSVELNRDMDITPVQLTDKARDYLKKVAGGDHITLGVKGGGCSGFQYVWDFKKNWPDVKWSAPIDDVLVLDPMAEIYVLGSTIDYVEELGGSFLQIKNPTAASSCGCGESFGL